MIFVSPTAKNQQQDVGVSKSRLPNVQATLAPFRQSISATLRVSVHTIVPSAFNHFTKFTASGGAGWVALSARKVLLMAFVKRDGGEVGVLSRIPFLV